VLNICLCTSILASSSDNEDGDKFSPPRKKQRTSADLNTALGMSGGEMQSNGCQEYNGTSHSSRMPSCQQNGDAIANGGIAHNAAPKNLSRTDRDIIRLVGQYLKTLGFQ
jgi:hypothetical protein